MNPDERIMRLQIEGSWTARDMALSLLSVRDLYNTRLGLQLLYEEHRDYEELFMELRHFPPFRRRLRNRGIFETLAASYPTNPADPTQLARLVLPKEELKVRRIEYSSPGLKDLAGVGEIVGHVKDFILKIIEHNSSRRRRELQDEEQELRNQALRIQNARDFVGLARDCGFEESELRRLALVVDQQQDPLVRLVEDGKIRKVLMLDDGEGDEKRSA